jgi:hypothetical protein
MRFSTIFLVLAIWIISEPLFAQGAGGNHLTFSYRYGGFNDRITDDLIHRERNHVLDLAYWINNEYALVASANIIRSNRSDFGTERMTAGVYSLSVRRNFLQQPRHQLYFELGAGVGDYCTCGDGVPLQRDNLRYLKSAIGYDYYLLKNIGVGLHFQTNYIVDKVIDKYAYNVIALSISFAIR